METEFRLKRIFSNFLFKKNTNDSEIGWISIPGGEYLMGSREDELNRNSDENQHLVYVPPFMISEYAITVHQFKEFIEATDYITDCEKETTKENGSFVWKGYSSKFKPCTTWKCNERGKLLKAKNFDHPVIHVSWNDAKAFADWKGCRLPTEAEWEYACRAGTVTRFNTGNELNLDLANYKPDNSSGKYASIEFRNEIVPVGKFKPNAWGLYDMHGNVAEWCNDYFATYPNEPQINPTGPESGEFRVVRGGSWLSNLRTCRSARRNSSKPDQSMYDLGFRVAFSL